MTLYFVCLEREWERIHRSGFSGERTVVFTTTPDHRGVGWWGRRDELVCSVTIDLPDAIARQYADEGGRVYRVPVAVANEYLERSRRSGRAAGGGSEGA